MSAPLAMLLFVFVMVLAGILLATLSSGSGALIRKASNAGKASHHGAGDNAAAASEPIEQLIEAVNARLPQTQCAQCGHPGCRPYATAIVIDDAPINQCPPGGAALISNLADFLGKPVMALDAQRGTTKPPQVAFIDESSCIGCTLCITACPVDAIVGASRLMHTVIAMQCTGCELCLPPCPVDCISLQPASSSLERWRWPKPA